LPDTWAAGDAYEPYIGRWSRLVARDFVAWLAVPPRQRWLDIGCGTGALMQTILAGAEPAEVTGVDPSEGFLATARKRADDARASFRIGDAQKLPVDYASADVAVSGLVLNFVHDPVKAISEMRRVVRLGGTIALLCLGLCRRDATDPPILGCRCRARSGG